MTRIAVSYPIDNIFPPLPTPVAFTLRSSTAFLWCTQNWSIFLKPFSLAGAHVEGEHVAVLQTDENLLERFEEGEDGGLVAPRFVHGAVPTLLGG